MRTLLILLLLATTAAPGTMTTDTDSVVGLTEY